MRILFAGIVGRRPFGDAARCPLRHSVGLRALGREIRRVEDTGA